MAFDVIIGRNESDKKSFGKNGLAYIGKSFVTMGNYTSLSNPIYMDVARTHVVLICGKRGCLTRDTMIFTDKGYKSIETFIEDKDKVLSFNKEAKKFEWEKAKLLKYDVDKGENLFKIELDDGRIINLTNEHPLLSSYGKYIYYRRACDLKVNDKIVLPLGLPEIKKDKESLEIARLLGFGLADGTINIKKGIFKDGRGRDYNGTKARFRIVNADEEVLSLAKKDLEKEFDIIVKRYKKSDCNCEIVETKHQKVVNKLMELGVPAGLKSHKIRVPKIVFQSSNKFKAEFVSALFDCDGFISKDSTTIDYSSKSRKFLEDLQILLVHFNIESTIKVKNAKLNGKIFENWRLFITDNVSIENFKKIGFNSKFKQERLNAHKPNGTRRRKTCYRGDLVCKKIRSIKKLKGVKEVYDLSVNKNHSFIANGIISHNSGKSYTMGAMAESLSDLGIEESGNISSVIFDTMGIYWTMKYKNEKDFELLQSWGMKAKNVPVRVFAPFGYYQDFKDKGVEVDSEFAIKLSELDASDWVGLFELSFTNPIAIVIESVINTLLENKKDFGFEEIFDLINKSENTSQDHKNAAKALFEAAKTWKVFDQEKGVNVRDLIAANQTTVIDLSMYASLGAFNVRALIIGLVCKKIFNERMKSRKDEEIQAVAHGADYARYRIKRDMPLVWIFIDEAHEFLPSKGKTPATNALVQLLREGRQPGISIVLATQQPGKIHTDAITQADIVMSHKITAKLDVDALNAVTQSYMNSSITEKINGLPKLKGSAIILDDSSERIYPMRIRPRFTWHGGEAPSAIKKVDEGL